MSYMILVAVPATIIVMLRKLYSFNFKKIILFYAEI